MVAARLGWPGFVGLLLIGLWAAAEFAWLPQQQTKIEHSEAESRVLRREIVHLNTEGQRNLAPQARLEALLAAFPQRRQLPEELARLNETLAAAGVRVDSAEYQPDSAKGGDFSALTVIMVVKLPYRRLRALFDAVREEMPTVAIDDVQLKRDAIGATEAEARLRFKLFLRQQT
jgi:Tfp pilus assembly protein PilO